MTTQRADAPATPQLGHYEIDTNASTVMFTVRHLFGIATVRGTFAIRAGTVDVAEPVADSLAHADIDAASFHTGTERRDDNVRSPSFLDTDRYPVMTFTSGRLHGSTLEGTLTVRGVTRPVSLTVEQPTVRPGSFTARATTRIDRTDFGVTAQRGIVGRHLDVALEIRCVRPMTAPNAGMGTYEARKDALLGALSGRILEIGAGYGANFSSFQAGIDWLGLEPDPDRRRHLARAAVAQGHHAPVITARAERIPLGDASVDAVVSTHVLCSVTDQQRVLAEIRRVLRPGGVFVFLEHVAAPPGTWSRRLQRCWAPISRRLDAGCDPGRDTWQAIRDGGFGEIETRWFAERHLVGVHTPFIAGTARTRLARWPNPTFSAPRADYHEEDINV